MAYSIVNRDGAPTLVVHVKDEERCPYFDDHGHECVNVASLCGEEWHTASAYECSGDPPTAWGRIRWAPEVKV